MTLLNLHEQSSLSEGSKIASSTTREILNSTNSGKPKMLKRELGLFGSTIMGLGSVIGAGLFVSLGVATGIAGSAVLLAVILAGILAIFTGLNSAQLSARHAVSGEAYEYGYRYLTPWIGFTGGWLYLIAKTATAATAALGFAGYLLNAFKLTGRGYFVPLAEAAVVILTIVVLTGIRKSNRTNIVILAVTIASLSFLIITGVWLWPADGLQNLSILQLTTTDRWFGQVLEATALMFIAYAGAARIATMGEEVVEPLKNIPRAIILTGLITMALYTIVAIVSLGSLGPDAFSTAAATEGAPLEVVAAHFGIPGGARILAIGATTAMLSVLLNAILGLSRVLLAMGRRHDMPPFLAQLNQAGTTPYGAVLLIGGTIALLVLTGDVKTTWSFSAFAGLTRSAIINLAALKMEPDDRLYSSIVAWLGLASCLFLAFWVQWQIWAMGLGLIGLGLIWHFVAQSLMTQSINQVKQMKEG